LRWARRSIITRSVSKHFDLDIGERHFTFTRKQQAVEAEAALDGITIIRTNVAAECVRDYKALSNVERVFRTLKTTDLKVPIYYRGLTGCVHISSCACSPATSKAYIRLAGGGNFSLNVLHQSQCCSCA
jgi:hypothetical protein